MNPKTRHKVLLEKSERVKRWYSNLRARSELTADVYLRNLGLWLESLNLDPDSVIDLARDNFDSFKAMISDRVRALEDENKAGSYISMSLKPLISYLKFHNVVVKLQINIKNENRNMTTENERVPTKEELATILRKATTRGKVAVSLMAFSGLRPESLGNYQGNDGLRISDIPDLNIRGDRIEFTTIPAQLIVRPELSKARHRYFTFIGSEGSIFLKEYLDQRISSGEKLDTDSPVILTDKDMSRKETANDYAMTTLISREIKRAITGSGFTWRPYVFRAYFAMALDIAEAKGSISHPWRQFIMGHKGDIEAVYSTKKRLSPEMVEEMRSAYAKASKYLETEEHGIKEEDYQKMLRDSAIEAFTGAFGITLTEEQKEELRNLETSEYQKRLGELFKDKRAEILNNGNKNKIIPVNKLTEYLDNKWELVQIFPKGDKAVIKLPS
ncbi:MAG: site-specific integrase [Candidatus Thermoplasmatota archaeon]|nr:site-specific integrase [Candidatus Thermoplasmatota archaeon]